MSASHLATRPGATCAPHPFRSGRRHRSALKVAIEMLRLWRVRAADRAELARLDARSLRDLGLTPGDVQREVGKPFWRA